MKLEKGDKVLVIDELIKGVVVNVNNNSAEIESEDGFLLTFGSDELIKIDVEQSEISKKVVVPHHLSLKTESNKPRQNLRVKKRKTPEHIMEVDLHIEKLIKSKKGLDNFDILTIQLDTAKHKLEFAIRNRIPKVIFIHGVGEGVLKEEIHYLCKRYNVSLSDASYQKYGMGATEVYIHQNTKG